MRNVLESEDVNRLPESCAAVGICLGRLAPDARAVVEACLAAEMRHFIVLAEERFAMSRSQL